MVRSFFMALFLFSTTPGLTATCPLLSGDYDCVGGARVMALSIRQRQVKGLEEYDLTRSSTGKQTFKAPASGLRRENGVIVEWESTCSPQTLFLDSWWDSQTGQSRTLESFAATGSNTLEYRMTSVVSGQTVSDSISVCNLKN